MNKSKFKAYRDVQESGATNMFDIAKVIELSDPEAELTKADCYDIMRNYSKYYKQYGE